MHDDHTPAGREGPGADDPGAAEPRPAEPRPADTDAGSGVEHPPRHPDPTRYGDWEKGGRCIDF